jgi:hypothetical protein
MRTTVDLDAPLVREVKRIQKLEGKAFGRIVSELVALGLRARKTRASARPGFHWTSQPMGARVDLADKEALRAVLDREEDPRPL